jgi:hypothetical protein
VSPGDPLREIVGALDRCAIPHMIAGSLASTFHGVPRATQDVDLVIDPSRPALESLVRLLSGSGFYVSEVAVEEAWRRRGQFNAIHQESGWKIDLILRKQRPFSTTEFERRQAAEILGTRAFVATAEDTVLAKLEWSRLGESERQLRDVIGILEMAGDRLDHAYLERWAAELGVADLLRRAREGITAR